MKRDLYENIDGNRNATVSAEDSPLLPANVMMHREADTSGKDAVSIKNHFNGADMVGMLSDLDMEFTYSDQSSIKKSNGMVSEGHAYFSQQLNFETPIRTENGTEISMIKMTVKSRVLLIGTVALIYPSPESIDFQGLFVKLFLSKPSPPVLSLNETTDAGQFSLNDTNEDPFAPLSRSRRAVSNSDNANASLVSEILERIGPVCLFFDRQFQLYSLNVNSVNLTLSASVSVQIDGANTSRIDVSLVLSVGQNLTSVVIQKFVRMVSLQELSDVNLNFPPIFRFLVSFFQLVLFFRFSLLMNISYQSKHKNLSCYHRYIYTHAFLMAHGRHGCRIGAPKQRNGGRFGGLRYCIGICIHFPCRLFLWFH